MDFGVGRGVCLVLVIIIMQDVHVIKLCNLKIKISLYMLSKSGTTTISTSLSQFVYMATCEWWNYESTWTYFFYPLQLVYMARASQNY